MRFEVYEDKGTLRWRWRLMRAGKAIACSVRDFTTKHEARAAAVRIRQDAQNAEVAFA